METRWVRRDDNGDFDPSAFYRFYSKLHPNTTLSSGQNQDAGGDINTTVTAWSSSENWQIRYQQGRYFLRNYDYGDYQLGLPAGGSKSQPKMIRRSGALEQQWSLMRGENGEGWKLSNGLLGNGSWLSVTPGNTIPAMQPSDEGATWDIQINPSAKSPQGSDLYTDVENFEVVSTSISSSTSISPTTPLATAAHNPSTSPYAVSTSPTLAAPPTGQSPDASSPSVAAIAGIAIGVAAFIIFCALFVWFLVRRRRERAVAELAGDNVYKHRVEIDSEPITHLAQEKGYTAPQPRFEMG